MLSKGSESFIDDLRQYLFASGKNLQEIDELTEELRVHLTESERAGKGAEEIITGTPQQYMETLRKEMEIDYQSQFQFILFIFIGMLAYIFLGPAILGEFSLNILQAIGFPIVTAIGLIIYISLLRQSGKHQYSTRKLFIYGVMAAGTVIFLYNLIMIGSQFFIAPFYVASNEGNWVIVGLCALVFVVLAIWSRTWFSIWIPAILFIPELLLRFYRISMEIFLTLQIGAFIAIFLIIFLQLLLTKRK